MNLPRAPMGATSGWRPADPPRRPVLFVNPRSGDGTAERAGLADRAREKGIETVILAPGQDLAALAREAAAAGADALGMAGGDGSLAVVAAAAAAHGIPFVCVPAGTRNHFALDLGVDRHDVAGAYALDRPLVTGTRPALDTGQLGIVALDAPGGSPHAPGRAWSTPRLEVNAPAAVHAGVDGEAVDLSPPLRLAIRPGALRVRISSRHPGASPSARPHLPGLPPPARGSQAR